MNTRTLIATAALAFAATGSAFAQEATVFPAADTANSVSREAVRAEAIRALQRGELSEAAILTRQDRPTSQATRQAVRDDTIRALRSGALDKLDAEAYSFIG